MDWYESVTGHRAGQKLDDSLSQDETLVETQQDLESTAGEMELDSSDAAHHAVNILSPRTATPNPFHNHPHPETLIATTQSSQFPALGSLGLTSSLTNDGHNGATERENPKSETFVADAADNLINAMTKMMNNRGRRSSQHSDEGIELEPESSQLSQPQRQMLQKVLSAALDRLSDDTPPAAPDPSDEKQDWFQCDICSKRTRLRCEMK